MNKVIAIDGPSGAGKSSLAKRVGKELGFLHVDSGALYRIITWQCLVHNVDTSNPEAVAACTAHVDVEFIPVDGRIQYKVNGEDPGEQIRMPEINKHASPVATVKAVRDKVTAWLRSLVKFGNIIVEGRDITTAVFPDSPARFYLDAAPEIRAARRQKEEVEKGIAQQSVEDVKASLLARDKIDSSRQHAPLRMAEGVFKIDNSFCTLDEVVQMVLDNLPTDWKK